MPALAFACRHVTMVVERLSPDAFSDLAYMQNFDLQQIIQDFADLSAAREPLLLALPQFVRQHFRAPGIVSVFHAGDLNVLAAGSSVGIAQGEQPPAAQKLAQVISAGTDSVQFESDELSDRPHV